VPDVLPNLCHPDYWLCHAGAMRPFYRACCLTARGAVRSTESGRLHDQEPTPPQPRNAPPARINAENVPIMHERLVAEYPKGIKNMGLGKAQPTRTDPRSRVAIVLSRVEADRSLCTWA
jgi:hypothetical protein